MQLLVLMPADMTGLSHNVEDGHNFVAHPIIFSLVDGITKIETVQQLVEARGEEEGRYSIPILILLIEERDDLLPFLALAGLGVYEREELPLYMALDTRRVSPYVFRSSTSNSPGCFMTMSSHRPGYPYSARHRRRYRLHRRRLADSHSRWHRLPLAIKRYGLPRESY